MQRGEQAQAEHGEQACTGVDIALTRVFELLGKRWTGLIVAVLTQGAAYYADLRRSLPKISERMLSDRLSELVDAGLVLREVEAGPPLRVAYRLTEAGLGLGPALDELGRWAETYLLDGIDPAAVLDGPCTGAHSSPSRPQAPEIC
ncbi:helix-turn-helix domain-containing protein [Streptomyces sp. NPDC006733]|uniref:winged helix-turn-helix transcriptional regulator n=1 Tax=Streptomyces sp. NPDC006733 TaxID=3155460 RepID=UPI003406DB3F